jgi:hypothetical protein
LDQISNKDSSGYPVDSMMPDGSLGYPVEEGTIGGVGETAPIQGRSEADEEETSISNQEAQAVSGTGEEEEPLSQQPAKWYFLGIGLAGSFLLAIIVSLLLAKPYFR